MPSAGGEPRVLLADEYDNKAPAWRPDGRHVLFTSQAGANLHAVFIAQHHVKQDKIDPAVGQMLADRILAVARQRDEAILAQQLGQRACSPLENRKDFRAP